MSLFMIYQVNVPRTGSYNGNWDKWVDRLDEFVKVCTILLMKKTTTTPRTNKIPYALGHVTRGVV